jgi:fluoride exporter
MQYFLIFLGGGAGSVLRYGLSRALLRYSDAFPYATLCANVAASAILMAVMLGVLRGSVSDAQRLLLGVGFCGGLSTFSTFSYETLQMLQTERYGLALLYVSANFFICLAAMYGIAKM